MLSVAVVALFCLLAGAFGLALGAMVTGDLAPFVARVALRTGAGTVDVRPYDAARELGEIRRLCAERRDVDVLDRRTFGGVAVRDIVGDIGRGCYSDSVHSNEGV